jgi:hypothetical protein
MQRRDKFGLGALTLALTAAAGSPSANAGTVLNVTPGSLLDVGSLCLTSSALCPGDATDLNLQNPFAAVSGDYIYTPTSATEGTMSFTLTLTSNAIFGSQTMLSGSTFTVSNVDVTESVFGGTEFLTQTGNQTTGAIVSSANMSFASGLSIVENTPFISNLNCAFAVGGGQCGVSLGGSVKSGLQFGPDPANGNALYNGALTFNTNITPVPLPASVWLMLGGLGCLFFVRRAAGTASRDLRL